MTGTELMKKTGVAFRLKQARMHARVTETTAGEAIGATANYIRAIEDGEFNPSIRRVAQLAHLYGASIDKIVGEAGAYHD